MANKAKQPLSPQNDLILVENDLIQQLSPAEITPERVGLKAYGLCSIPSDWTLPFFVICGGGVIGQETITNALTLSKIKPSSKVIVRSSGVLESIDSRGSLDSEESTCQDIIPTINTLRSRISDSNPDIDIDKVHWIVQPLAPLQIKGHLSNERRLSEALRDWVVEVEATGSTPPETHKIPIRKWRDARPNEIRKLDCQYKANYINSLESVARWAHNRKLRVHFEWVWDGKTVYIVQADECNEKDNGVDPTKLTAELSSKTINFSPKAFRIASDEDYKTYTKLSNAKIYRELGYTAITFFVLDCKRELDLILNEGTCSPSLINDLKELTQQPLVIRTDGTLIPDEQRQMLPRSNELRTTEAAIAWLTDLFRNKIIELKLEHSELCLVAHHFIPASASAWSQAHPDKRRVRIESLWGLPEGLYWYAHDVFDVDTNFISAKELNRKPENFSIRERLRYKGRFVAPNQNGEWVVHHTASSHDWKRSITRQEWIEEIAWTSKRIAERLNKAVVIMWFIDIPKTTLKHSVLPWYHEDWKHEGPLPKAAPRKKLTHSEEFTLRTKADWLKLKGYCEAGRVIARVFIDPSEPELVRDQQFAKELAQLAHKYRFVIELSGGLLSHAYYMLTSSGCQVECADLYATEEGELEFHKLVRDKIPENIHSRGEEVKLLKLEGEALITALKRKIVEEALEVLDAETSQSIIEELADLKETVNALTKALSITDKNIEDARKYKKEKRGAFDSALMLEKTSLASSLSLSQDTEDDPFSLARPHIERTISRAEQLPYYIHDIHSDKRHDVNGTFERQFTLSLPAHSENFTPPRVNFTLESSNGSTHEYILSLEMDRRGSDIRCKIRIINAPTQMSLDL